jgi:hypothetical protein
LRPKRTRSRLTLVAALAACFAALALAPEAAAQCPLCRTALEGAGASAARTMNLAIVVLLVPPVAIFVAIFAALRRGGRDDEE